MSEAEEQKTPGDTQQPREPVRDLMRLTGEPIEQTMRLQDRGDEVRMGVMKSAWEMYDDVPKEVSQWYVPGLHAVVIPLPGVDGGE